jgi:non-reducing end alpha-L-arabinofuranosidase
VREGSMVLRDASGLVVDSLNYGGLVDPWAAEGYQAGSGMGKSGCYVTTPGGSGGSGPAPSASASNTSAGRFPDGRDTDSNCDDFVAAPATTLAAASTPGATNIKVVSVNGFDPGETIRIDSGANLETARIATVGTAGATTSSAAVAAGATVIHVASAIGFNDGQTITVDSGANSETAVIAFVTPWEGTITVVTPLAHPHAAGAEISGSGIALTVPLSREHAREALVTGSVSTPGAPNHYSRISR